MRRPSRFSEDIIAKLADSLLPEVCRWVDATEPEVDSIRKDLLNVLESYDLDGYVLAKELDDLGWTVDADLVDILDHASVAFYRIISQAEKDWVKAYSIEPSLAIGSKVIASSCGKDNIGTIASIDKEKGYYNVRYADGKEYVLVYENVRSADPQ